MNVKKHALVILEEEEKKIMLQTRRSAGKGLSIVSLQFINFLLIHFSRPKNNLLLGKRCPYSGEIVPNVSFDVNGFLGSTYLTSICDVFQMHFSKN